MFGASNRKDNVTKNPVVDAWFAKKQHPMEEAMQAVRELALSSRSSHNRVGQVEHPHLRIQGQHFQLQPGQEAR